ncbi:MAG: hypothetical protein BGO32_11780 [Bacteroidetes bacterium 37-13]|nr:MAG: hypothetical protein BGO32_11780 [Bacteroidetes bacterium 37-13]
MNKIYLFLSAICTFSFSVNAQVVYTFENLSVAADSFTSSKNLNGGFGDSLVYFHSFWDTAYGGYWGNGFVPSSKQDIVTPGFSNQYSAITGSGYSSSTYAVNYGSGSIKLSGNAAGKNVKGFYITNTTYAYLSMKDGDGFAKKFGGTNGTDSDYFYVTVKGYLNGTQKTDTVNFYLADYRFADSTQDYILSDWAWVNLAALGNIDSLSFQYTSSDTGSLGINTPVYFAMDNFTFYDGITALNEVENINASVYPNPIAAGQLFNVELTESKDFSVTVSAINGAVVKTESFVKKKQAAISTDGLLQGIYFATIRSKNSLQTVKLNVY